MSFPVITVIEEVQTPQERVCVQRRLRGNRKRFDTAAMSRRIAHGMRVLAWQIRIGWQTLLRQPAGARRRDTKIFGLQSLQTSPNPGEALNRRWLLIERRAENDVSLVTRPANRDRPRQTAPGSPRPETRPSSDRRCGRTPKRPHVRARAREPCVRPRLDLGPHELHPASGRLPHPDRMR